MKILGVTMGKSLQVFAGLFEVLKENIRLEPPAIFVADSLNFRLAQKDHPLLTQAELLKEWDLTGKGAKKRAKAGRIEAYEKRLGENLWNALLADRRIFFGSLCKVRQDYQPRFTYDQLLGILDNFLVAVDEFIDRVQPDFVLSFGTATLGDYLFELFAREKRIPYLQLKSTKIKNYVALNDTGTGIPGGVQRRYFSDEPFDRELVTEANEFLDTVIERGVRYEGAILFGRKHMARRLVRAPVNLAGAALHSVRTRLDPVVRNDNHVPPLFLTALYSNLVHPVRTFRLGKALPFLTLNQLEKQQPFLFYPLHFEPEVSLQVFGRPFQNQIETVRNLALGLPAGMRALVKEHPRSLGFRKKSYYRKLLDIPNVSLVDPFLPAVEVVKRASIVAVVSGSIGFEAAVCGKPVIVLGNVPYQILPDSMIRKVTEPDRLGFHISDLLEHYHYDRDVIERFVCAVMEESIPVDLYTVLLGKTGRYSLGEAKGSAVKKQKADYKCLSDYIVGKVERLRARA